jgi:cytochrome c2
MKRIIVAGILGSMALMLAQCSPKPRASMVSTAADAPAKVAEVNSKYSEEDIASGKNIFENKCNTCHKLKLPETRNVEKWEKVLPRMVNLAKLDDTQAGKVRAYVLSHAKVE